MAAPSSFFTYGKVTDTYYGVLGDTDDDIDDDPDLATVTGTVTFTPTLSAPLLFTSAPFVATPLKVEAVYNEQGQLSLNGVPSVKLVSTDNPLQTLTGWAWAAAFDVQVNGIPITRPGFSFKLPGNSTVDLSSVQTIATVNGIQTTAGPKGDPGVGIRLRGVLTGTGSSVLPSGYGQAQDGYAYRVRSVDGSYDELWSWVWTGTAGSWVDAGPAIAAAVIDDSRTTSFTTYSAAQIEARIQSVLSASQNYTSAALLAYSADDYERRQTATGWPLRNAPADRHVVWVGTDYPPVGNGYALPGWDEVELVAVLPS